MKPGTAAVLQRATEALATIRATLHLIRPETTIHDCYYTMFRVARAYVEDRTGTRPRTHAGLIAVFDRLTKAEAQTDYGTVKLLGASFTRRMSADYDDLPEFDHINAEAALEDAEAFVDLCRRLLAS